MNRRSSTHQRLSFGGGAARQRHHGPLAGPVVQRHGRLRARGAPHAAAGVARERAHARGVPAAAPRVPRRAGDERRDLRPLRGRALQHALPHGAPRRRRRGAPRRRRGDRGARRRAVRGARDQGHQVRERAVERAQAVLRRRRPRREQPVPRVARGPAPVRDADGGRAREARAAGPREQRRPRRVRGRPGPGVAPAARGRRRPFGRRQGRRGRARRRAAAARRVPRAPGAREARADALPRARARLLRARLARVDGRAVAGRPRGRGRGARRRARDRRAAAHGATFAFLLRHLRQGPRGARAPRRQVRGRDRVPAHQVAGEGRGAAPVATGGAAGGLRRGRRDAGAGAGERGLAGDALVPEAPV